MTDKEKPNSQSNGRCVVELWHSNWIYIAADNEISGIFYDGVPDDAYEPLVELISGGAVSYDDIVANPEKYLINDTFVEDAIAPTVVVKDVPPAG